MTAGKPPGTTETVRLEAFSDGVFAIAITLLVLEIRVPGSEEVSRSGGLLPALSRLWPSYIGYVISFVTIGIMWANHHSIFQHIAYSDRYFLLINVVFLMCISFLPFPTAVLAGHLANSGTGRAAAAFYSGSLVLIALAYNALWWYAARRRRLLDPAADSFAVRTISRRYLVGPAAYGLALALAFVNVWACLAVHGTLAAFYLLPEHKARKRASGRS